MKTYLKWTALALALTLAAAPLAGCGGKQADTPAPASQASDAPAASGADTAEKTWQVALVSDMAVDEAEWLQNLVAGLGDYQKEHPNIEIKKKKKKKKKK